MPHWPRYCWLVSGRAQHSCATSMKLNWKRHAFSFHALSRAPCIALQEAAYQVAIESDPDDVEWAS